MSSIYLLAGCYGWEFDEADRSDHIEAVLHGQSPHHHFTAAMAKGYEWLQEAYEQRYGELEEPIDPPEAPLQWSHSVDDDGTVTFDYYDEMVDFRMRITAREMG